jgi:hypothetical protein
MPKSLIDSNPYLSDPDERRAALRVSAASSSAVEGIPPTLLDRAARTTGLGKRLLAIRKRALAKGMPTMTQDEVLAEVRRRRDEPIDNG